MVDNEDSYKNYQNVGNFNYWDTNYLNINLKEKGVVFVSFLFYFIFYFDVKFKSFGNFVMHTINGSEQLYLTRISYHYQLLTMWFLYWHTNSKHLSMAWHYTLRTQFQSQFYHRFNPNFWGFYTDPSLAFMFTIGII